jgi:hypothetical protein
MEPSRPAVAGLGPHLSDRQVVIQNVRNRVTQIAYFRTFWTAFSNYINQSALLWAKFKTNSYENSISLF